MKQDTAVIFLKAACYMIIGAGTPASVAVAQWLTEKKVPNSLDWVSVTIGAGIGMSTQLLSYLSGSYSDYVKGRANGSARSGDTTQFVLSKMSQADPTTTTPPKP